MSTWPAWNSPAWKEQYSEYQDRYRQLADEVTYVLQQELSTANIKIHAISNRVKSQKSVERKLRRAGQNNGAIFLFDGEPRYHFGLKDVVGIRIVCMFLSQMNEIIEIIQRIFNVIEEDRKTKTIDATSFGYMSDHVICELRDDFKGSRYDRLKGIAFELQIRTIAMDAWAAVSHHLDYKNDFGIPTEFKRDFHALSGLFHIIDTHFEILSKQVDNFRLTLESFDISEDKEPIDLNRDAIHSYLRNMFPEREIDDGESAEEFLNEVLAVGYKSIQEIDRDIRRGLPALMIAELEHPPTDADTDEETKYTAVGAARGALDLAKEDFRRLRLGDAPDSYARYRKFVAPRG